RSVTYLDAASAEPLHPAAEQAMVATLKDGWADPSRLYGAGRRARLALDAARQHLAEAIGARPDELAFTGSGTLACHLAVLGTLAGRRRGGPPRVGSGGQSSGLLNGAKEYAGEVTTVPVDR